MCVILIAYQILAETPLLILANRDEFTDRPVDSLRLWPNEDIVAGVDDPIKGGSYLAMHRKTGRWAAVVNVRQLVHPPNHQNGTNTNDTTPTPVGGGGGNSRGRLVIDFCTSEVPVESYRETILTPSDLLYDSYSLIYGTIESGFYYYSNHAGFAVPAQKLQPGILYGLSNGDLDAWPKVQRGKNLLHQKLELFQQQQQQQQSPPPPGVGGHGEECNSNSNSISDDELFEILKDDWRPNEDNEEEEESENNNANNDHRRLSLLPDTGVGKTTERFLASIFIPSYYHQYGTIASTIVRVSNDGNVRMVERTFRHDDESEYTYVAEQSFRL
jgi:uncharacterized protein with NRDE domain